MLTIQTVRKGRHDFKPNRLIINSRDKLEFTVRFWPSCRYDFKGDADQLDWNKGGGWSYNLFSNHVLSNMWAWRYAPENDKIQFGHYCHIDRKVVKTETIFEANINTLVPGILDTSSSRKEFSLIIGSAENIFEVGRLPEISRMIWGYFGGDNNSPGPFGGVAPHDMTYEYRIF